MQKIVLYRYARPDGGTTVSPVKPDCEYTVLYRLVADEGKIISNGKEATPCIDTETPDEWSELEEICESHDGTLEDPIPYDGNMALENGKYYMQDGVIYKCVRDTVNPVYNALNELIGIYVETA